MSWWVIVLIVIVVLAAILAGLYFAGNKMQKKQAEQEKQIQEMAQWVNMLVIDKKKLKLNEAGLPAVVMEQTPKYMRRAKMPIVKAKVGPQILSLICDANIFDSVPVKKEIKAKVSGIYITEIKGIRGSLSKAPEKKKGKFKAWVEKMQEKAGAKPLK